MFPSHTVSESPCRALGSEYLTMKLSAVVSNPQTRVCPAVVTELQLPVPLASPPAPEPPVPLGITPEPPVPSGLLLSGRYFESLHPQRTETPSTVPSAQVLRTDNVREVPKVQTLLVPSGLSPHCSMNRVLIVSPGWSVRLLGATSGVLLGENRMSHYFLRAGKTSTILAQEIQSEIPRSRPAFPRRWIDEAGRKTAFRSRWLAVHRAK
jgi:hypothetical protein